MTGGNRGKQTGGRRLFCILTRLAALTMKSSSHGMSAECKIVTMPVHDWTRVTGGTFHSFHHGWIAELTRALNGGVLPDDYYALSDTMPCPSSRPAPTGRTC